MLVREFINFERGLDPKETMGIGRKLIQLSNKTGMTPSELRLTKSRMKNLFNGEIEFRNFIFWLKRWVDKPADHSIDTNTPVYDDIVWANQNFKEAFDLLNLDDTQMYEDVQNFERGQNPKESIGIGYRLMIKNWIEAVNSHEIYSEDDLNSRFGKNPENHIARYHINDDLTIDIRTNSKFGDALIIRGQEIRELPEFIQFGRCDGNFYINASGLETMRGFPKIVTGHLCINNNKLTSLDYLPEEIGAGLYIHDNKVEFTKEEILKRCKLNPKKELRL